MGIFIFSPDSVSELLECLLFSHNTTSRMCFGESCGFFPFFLSKLLLSRNVCVFRHDENSLSSKELPTFLFCIPSVISVRAEIQALRMLLLSTCLQVPQEGDSDESLSSACLGCCPASEQEWLRNNLKSFSPVKGKIHLLHYPIYGKLIHLRIN